MSDNTIRIGGGCGFWGESARATPQLLAAGRMDYIIYDYLAETTMALMARARAQDPDQGYARDFITAVLAPNLTRIANTGTKIIANAGGVNVAACAAAVRELIAKLGLDLRVAAISGDDLSNRPNITHDMADMFTGAPAPQADSFQSINAYLGAAPIAAALRAGADIVITGRVVDSALTLGACIHSFNWDVDDLDLMAAGSLIGHIIECGPQATGGNFTDWHLVDDMANIGYPIAEISADGKAVISKPKDSGGIVTPGTVGEQILYEISDPSAYILPDVICDFTDVTLQQVGADRVLVSNAKGRGRPDTYKVCATYLNGWRAGVGFNYMGHRAADKAMAYKDAALARIEQKLRASNLGPFDDMQVDLVGAGTQIACTQPDDAAREVMMHIAVRHRDRAACTLLAAELIGLGLSMPPGLTLSPAMRGKPQPVLSLFSFLIDKSDVAATISIDGAHLDGSCSLAAHAETPADSQNPDTISAFEVAGSVPLWQVAYLRSGDKGDISNIGVMARDAKFLPYIASALTAGSAQKHMAHYLQPDSVISRYYLPGFAAFNFTFTHALGGGGITSLRIDPQGKAFGQVLAEFEIPLPADMMEQLS